MSRHSLFERELKTLSTVKFWGLRINAKYFKKLKKLRLLNLEKRRVVHAAVFAHKSLKALGRTFKIT